MRCRARVAPSQVGLSRSERRRGPGLRREDVAVLADVSITWYTWLEQGREIKISADVLERIAAALLMSATEREFLFSLAQHRAAPPVDEVPVDTVSPAMERMLGAIAVPALVMTARWDVIAWNELTRIFRNYDELAPERRNLLRIVLVEDESYQLDPVRHEQMVRRGLSKFRVDYSQNPGNPAFEELVADLTAESALFRRLWNSPEVMTRLENIGHYPHLGGISFKVSSYMPEGRPTLRLVVYTPHDDQTTEKLAEWQRRASGAEPAGVTRDRTAH
jgi:transcriptional regulator with XRE-family HTH domain